MLLSVDIAITFGFVIQMFSQAKPRGWRECTSAPGVRRGDSGLNQIPIPSLLPVADLNYKLAEEHVPALVSVEKSKAVTMLSDGPAFAY